MTPREMITHWINQPEIDFELNQPGSDVNATAAQVEKESTLIHRDQADDFVILELNCEEIGILLTWWSGVLTETNSEQYSHIIPTS